MKSLVKIVELRRMNGSYSGELRIILESKEEVLEIYNKFLNNEITYSDMLCDILFEDTHKYGYPLFDVEGFIFTNGSPLDHEDGKLTIHDDAKYWFFPYKRNPIELLLEQGEITLRPYQWNFVNEIPIRIFDNDEKFTIAICYSLAKNNKYDEYDYIFEARRDKNVGMGKFLHDIKGFNGGRHLGRENNNFKWLKKEFPFLVDWIEYLTEDKNLD